MIFQDVQITIGYFAVLAIGLILGLIGGGGSILTVPVLVYLFNVDPVLSTSYSLFIVGISSIIGAVSFAKRGQIRYKTAFFFGLPSIMTVYLTRKFVVPNIPEMILFNESISVSKDALIMSLFAMIMIVTAIAMLWKKQKELAPLKSQSSNGYWKIILEGLIVGLLTGIVGAGGGFMIIPVLILRMSMKEAIGTSLLIIATKSLIGFTGDLSILSINWLFLIKLSFITSVGILAGILASKRVSSKHLKSAFGWFVLVCGVLIFAKEFLI